MVEEVRVIEVLVRHAHLMPEPPSDHLAHDLAIQSGEVHHVEVEDQVDGIVLAMASSLI